MEEVNYETNLPADIPSYLSSQGTLADRQDGYVSSESGSHHQFVTASGGGFFLPQHESTGACNIDNSSEADVEAATDPFLCPFLGSSGPVYLKGGVYGPDPFEAYHTGCSTDPRTALVDHYEPNYVKKKGCYPRSHPTEESCERSLSGLGWPAHVKKLGSSSYCPNEGPLTKNLYLNKNSSDFSSGLEPAPVTSTNPFMGTFGKPLRRSHLDAFTSFGQLSDCQPRAFPLKTPSSLDDLDSDSEDERERTDFQEEKHTRTYKQTLENYRTPNFQSHDLDT
ncbi:leucine-rich repeats and immunoglobulin-like domains protein 3 [Octodon degus]|uniref:leucine-rich repeats and immunoglobulin-like domains protein 3 n=1 Tax=Octodon degus TaxID=10160 RepID=UPI000C9F0D4E|nr:leucine-rich repeats and immunoglobulin-like domains protein 3 [Octodon degus]